MLLEKKNIWIMVANGSLSKIFHNNGSKLRIKLLQEASSALAHLSSKELRISKPGRVYESANPARHAIEPKTDPHRKEKIRFAHNIASLLNEGATSHKFNELILIAPPEFLGDIRAQLIKHALKLIKKEINKDLTHLKEKEILSYIF